MIEIYDFAELDDKKKNTVARLVSLSTVIDGEKDRPLLVPVTIEEILTTADARVALAAKGLFAGYIRAKADVLRDENNVAFRQVGTLTVLREYRGNGVGRDLVSAMTDSVAQENTPFAFVNPTSERTFVNAGYRQAHQSELPKDAVSRLGNQAMIFTDDL